jgi:hypothetical protein
MDPWGQARVSGAITKFGYDAVINALTDELAKRGLLTDVLNARRIFDVSHDELKSEIDEQARRAYQAYADNHPTIHCNRFPPWDELDPKSRDIWVGAVERARAEEDKFRE